MSSYKTLKFRIIGVCPLLMKNGQTVDPLNAHSRSIAEITSKRKKTDGDHREIGRREFMAGLYLMNGEPCLPGEMMEVRWTRKTGQIVKRESRLGAVG